MPGKKILVLDDDASRRKFNVFGLRCAGFGVDEAADPPAARSQIAHHYPNLLLMCVALLDLGAQDFVQLLRRDASTRELPVMVLAERQSERDALCALECGADDYLAAPFSPEEMVERINAVAKRDDARASHSASEFAGLTLDHERRELSKGARAVTLGPTDMRVLEFFLSHPERVIPRDLILFRIWGGASNVSRRAVDVSVCRLRSALQQLGCGGLLRTVSRHGYRLSTDVRRMAARVTQDA